MRAVQRSNHGATMILAVLGVVAVMGMVNGSTAQADDSKANLRNELGITYAKEGHFEDALRSFSLVLAEDPAHAAALNNSANIYFVQGEMQRARMLYERAIESQGQEGGIHLNLGILLHSMGDDQASAASVRRGLELIGDPHEAYYLLGLSQQRPGENDRAADASELKSSEIEELLAAAMADIPSAAKAAPKNESATDASPQEARQTMQASTTTTPPATQTVSTRPGGAKASQAGQESSQNIVADRLFWMSTLQSP